AGPATLLDKEAQALAKASAHRLDFPNETARQVWSQVHGVHERCLSYGRRAATATGKRGLGRGRGTSAPWSWPPSSQRRRLRASSRISYRAAPRSPAVTWRPMLARRLRRYSISSGKNAGAASRTDSKRRKRARTTAAGVATLPRRVVRSSARSAPERVAGCP